MDLPGSAAHPHGGVKRRKSDGKRLHSPPKRQRTAADSNLEELVEEVLLTDPSDHSDGGPGRTDNTASDQDDESQLYERMFPALRIIVCRISFYNLSLRID